MSDECTYCGDVATARDHIVPVSVCNLVGDPFNLTVPCCHQCNSIASNKLFASVKEKRKFIKERLKEIFAKELGIPYWSDEELEELGWTLREPILKLQKSMTRLRERIAYNAENSSCPNVIGRDIAVRAAVKRIRKKIKDA